MALTIGAPARELGLVNETAEEWAQGIIDLAVSNKKHDKKYHDFNALTDEQKDTAITAGKGA